MINFYLYGDGLDKEDVYKHPIIDFQNRAVGNRVPLIEHIIMKDPCKAYWYARYTIKGRWYEAEPYIMKSPKWVCWYAYSVISERWIEAEPGIMEDCNLWEWYCEMFDI